MSFLNHFISLSFFAPNTYTEQKLCISIFLSWSFAFKFLGCSPTRKSLSFFKAEYLLARRMFLLDASSWKETKPFWRISRNKTAKTIPNRMKSAVELGGSEEGAPKQSAFSYKGVKILFALSWSRSPPFCFLRGKDY